MDYTALATKANNLIDKFGAGVVLTQISLGTYSTDTHSYSSTTATYSYKGVSRESVKALFPGSLAEVSDADFLLQASLAVAPEPNDSMTFSGTNYYIERARPVAPGGITVLYKVWVKA